LISGGSVQVDIVILRLEVCTLPASVVYLGYARSTRQTRRLGYPLVRILPCVAGAPVFAKDLFGQRFMFLPLPICSSRLNQPYRTAARPAKAPRAYLEQ
jgi:hypothetical protein